MRGWLSEGGEGGAVDWDGACPLPDARARVRWAAVWGVVAAVLNLVPYVGALFTAGALSLVAFLQFGTPGMALAIGGATAAPSGQARATASLPRRPRRPGVVVGHRLKHRLKLQRNRGGGVEAPREGEAGAKQRAHHQVWRQAAGVAISGQRKQSLRQAAFDVGQVLGHW